MPVRNEERLAALEQWITANTPDLPILIPISGGTDSALCFWLYNKIFGTRVIGVYIGTTLRAREWFESIGTVRVIEAPPDMFHDPELVRWAQLLKIALDDKRLLVGARNKTEHILGTFSLASRVASHLPLTGLWKSEVLALCEHIGVPAEVIESSRKADVACGRPDELVQISVELVDDFLRTKIGELPIHDKVPTLEDVAYLERLYQQQGFKRTLPLLPQ